MSKPCQHAASGCNYPEAQCPGHCHFPGDDSLRQRQTQPAYLTIVYRITEPRQPRALLDQAEWSAASHTHAIQERDRLHAELNDVQDQRREAFRAIERLNDELGQVCEQRGEYADAILAMLDREDNDCMPVGWSMDRVRELAQKIRRCSSDRNVRRSHDDQYVVHDVASTRTGKAT